jgi:hypothetical protein
MVSACNRSGHDHRATRQTAIPRTEINARRPTAEGYQAPGVRQLEGHQVMRLNDLEAENAQLRKAESDPTLEKLILKEAA